MKIQFVTSFSDKYYREQGKAFLQSFLKHWDYPIVAYYEDTAPDIEHPNLTTKCLYNVPGAVQFLSATAKIPLMTGITRKGGKKNYNYDINRFSRKVFAECDAYQHTTADILVWIDSDIIIEKPLPDNWFEDRFKDGDFMLYMRRNNYHGCSSFVAWDLRHEQSADFWNYYHDSLVSGRFLVLKEWHDISIKERLMDDLKLQVNDIAADVDLPDGPINVFDAVFSGIAIHNKGKMKKGGPRRYNQLMLEIRKHQPKSIMEIGTWNGFRAVEMSKANPGMDYIGFDLFEDATPETDHDEKNVKPHFTVNDVANALKRASFNSVTLIKGNTNTSLPAFIDKNDKKVDMVFLDGGHSVDTIRSDLKYAMSMLNDGGVIVLDDYYEEMPEEDLDKWGCNRVLDEMGIKYKVLPVADRVAGGGLTKMAIIGG